MVASYGPSFEEVVDPPSLAFVVEKGWVFAAADLVIVAATDSIAL